MIISILTVVKKKNTKNKGMEIAGVIYTIIAVIISLIFVLVNTFMEEAEDYYYPTATSLQNQLLSMYDNKRLSGIAVCATFRQYMYMQSSEVTIVWLDSDNGKILATVGEKKLSYDSLIKKEDYYEIQYEDYIANNGTSYKTSMNEFNNPESELYIDRYKEYNSYVLRLAEGNSNTKVVGVVIIK